MNLGQEEEKGKFRRVQNIEFLKEICREIILIVFGQKTEKPKGRDSCAHHKRLQPETKKWKKRGVPTDHREEDTTRRTNSIQKRQRKDDSPYIEERTRSSNKNARRGGDQQRQDQERRGACTKKSLSLEFLVGNANYKS
ncbi:hypothetical protein TNCV_846741 [Trichonephila clavipes]|nr:hypothetical protein TNCV_846741 [Trichonephila clavipes]